VFLSSPITLLLPETSVHQHRASYGLAQALASDQQQYEGGDLFAYQKVASHLDREFRGFAQHPSDG